MAYKNNNRKCCTSSALATLCDVEAQQSIKAQQSTDQDITTEAKAEREHGNHTNAKCPTLACVYVCVLLVCMNNQSNTKTNTLLCTYHNRAVGGQFIQRNTAH